MPRSQAVFILHIKSEERDQSPIAKAQVYVSAGHSALLRSL